MNATSWIKQELGKIDHSTKALRRFGYTVGIVFLLLGVLLIARDRAAGAPLSLCASALMILALVSPKILRPFHSAWMAISLVIGFVVTRVILTAVFFLFVTPIGLLQRMCKRSPIELAFRDGSETYWEQKSGAGTTAEYENQF